MDDTGYEHEWRLQRTSSRTCGDHGEGVASICGSLALKVRSTQVIESWRTLFLSRGPENQLTRAISLPQSSEEQSMLPYIKSHHSADSPVAPGECEQCFTAPVCAVRAASDQESVPSHHILTRPSSHPPQSAPLPSRLACSHSPSEHAQEARAQASC